MSERWKGLLVGLLAGVLVAGLGVGVWWRLRKPDLTEDQWLARLAVPGSRAPEELAKMGDFGLEVLLKGRQSQDIRVHRRAARGLVAMGEEAVPALVRLLPRAGGRVGVILVAIGTPALPALQEALGKESSAPAAARVLGRLGERAEPARVALLGVLQDPKRDDKARAEAAWALGQLDPDEATRGVIAAVARFAASSVREQCFRALGAMGKAARPSASALIAALDGADERLADLAAEMLGRIEAESAVPALVRAAVGRTGLPALEALARIGTPVRPSMDELLRGVKGGNRVEMMTMLGPMFVPELIERLADPALRLGAMQALGEIGPPAGAARGALEALLTDKDRRVVLAAAAALLSVTADGHEKPAEALLGLLKPDEAVRREVLSLGLGGVGSTQPLAAAVAVLLSEAREDGTAATAVRLLGRVVGPTPAVIEALRREIKGGEPLEGLRAAERGGSAFRALAPEVKAALASPDQRVARQAARALASIAPDQAGPALRLLRREIRNKFEASNLNMLERPPVGLLETLRAELPQAGSKSPRLLAGYPREDLVELIPDLVGILDAHPGSGDEAAALLRYIGPPVLPFMRPMIAGQRLPAAAAVLTDPHLKLSDADLDAVARRAEDPDMRMAAGAILAAQGASTAASRGAARALLGHPEPELRALGAKALCVSPEDKQDLRRFLLDPAPAVRVSAVAALGPDDVRPSLLDGDPAVRLEAARRLLASEADRAAVVRVLLRLARGASPAGRADIADLLPADAEGLVPLMEADSRAGGLAASAWLVRNLKAKASEHLVRLEAGLTRPESRQEAARLLGTLGSKGRPSLPWLRRQLGFGPTQAEREAARDAIKRVEAG